MYDILHSINDTSKNIPRNSLKVRSQIILSFKSILHTWIQMCLTAILQVLTHNLATWATINYSIFLEQKAGL